MARMITARKSEDNNNINIKDINDDSGGGHLFSRHYIQKVGVDLLTCRLIYTDILEV